MLLQEKNIFVPAGYSYNIYSLKQFLLHILSKPNDIHNAKNAINNLFDAANMNTNVNVWYM